MEEQRCRMAATKTADFRCSNLLDGAQIELEDRRYKSLDPTAGIEVEDSRCNSVSIALEDPRCQCLASQW